MKNFLFAACLAVLAASAAPAAAEGVDMGVCLFAPKPHEGFKRWIGYCDDAARQVDLKGIPELAAKNWFSLGKLYHFDHQYDKAVESYTRSLARESKVPDVLVARGDAYRALGKDELARADYQAAAVLERPSPQHLDQRCWMRTLRGGPLDLAAEDCDSAIAAMPDSASARFSRCVLRYRGGRFADALADCDAALARDSKIVGALYFRGLAKRKTGDASGGDADVADALRINRRLADGYEIFGLN
jgi:tetratricopeptide (TPR) repeat protein